MSSRSSFTVLTLVLAVGMAANLKADEQPVALVQSAGEDLAAGEGASRPNESIQSVASRMKAAEAVLAAHDASGKASAAQQQAVDELDAMIAQLQKQCEKCGGQCQKPRQTTKKPPKPSGKSGQNPGESVAAAKTAAAAQVDRSAVENLVKDLWGRLPERQREELLQPLSEEFLPEYADDIEAYFRALAEEPPAAAEAQP